VGEYSTPSPPGVQTPPAIDLIDDSCLYIKAPMDEVDAPKITAGQPVRISLDALPKQSFAGHGQACRAVCFGGREAGAHRRHRSHLQQPGRAPGKLLVGYSADVEVILAVRDDVVRVPTAALLEGGRVLVAGKDGKLEERKIRTGLANWEFTEVLEGLAAGERVVTSLERVGVKAGANYLIEGSPCRQSEGQMMVQPLIALAGVERVFQLGDSEVHALHQLDLQIDAGEYVAVMGPSGSGKSTLLNLLGLLDRPNAGTYRLEGRDVTTLSAEEQARVRSERIGFVFQSFHLVPRLTAAENIALPMVLSGIARRNAENGSIRRSRTMA
jgi:ABC-type multidrug transport system fused ATPase/permease subunit